MVLKHPEIPLHNNPAELDATASACESVWWPTARSEHAKAGIPLQHCSARPEAGRECLPVHLRRISGTRQMPALADLISNAKKRSNLSSSWAGPNNIFFQFPDLLRRSITIELNVTGKRSSTIPPEP